MSLVSGYSTSYSSAVNDNGATAAVVTSANHFYSSPVSSTVEYHQNFFTPSNWSTANNWTTTAQNEFPSAQQIQNSPPISCYSSSVPSPSDYYNYNHHHHHHHQQHQHQQQYESVVSESYHEDPQQPNQPITTATPAVRVVRVVKRRNTANKKERRRTMSINNAFSELRDCIPNVPADTKLSKIKTLRLATSYISYLMTVLDDGSDIPFRAELGRERKSDKMAAAAAAAAAAQQQQQSQQLYNPNCMHKEQVISYSIHYKNINGRW